MKFIIDGNYNKELISLIVREELPVTHVIVHVPQNPIGNSSILLPKVLPKFKEFEEYTKHIRDQELIPIAGIDSTCQGNFEAHMQQYKAVISLFQTLKELEFKDILVSSPNNLGFVKENLPSMKIYLSHSQYVTSLNRARIFFEIGAESIILHPDIIRSFQMLKNLLKLKEKLNVSRGLDYILPLNLGCNWGCIHWYQHHNMQSHRTLNSPVFNDQHKISDVKDEFDYPMLYCWKKRLQEPINFLKAGWISPDNIELYEELGYKDFLLFTNGFSNEKILQIIKSYQNKSLDKDFQEFLNIPEPYGDYWLGSEVKNSKINLSPDVMKEFCTTFPYNNHYPTEHEIDIHCRNYIEKLRNGKNQKIEQVINLISNKMREMEKGVKGG